MQGVLTLCFRIQGLEGCGHTRFRLPIEFLIRSEATRRLLSYPFNWGGRLLLHGGCGTTFLKCHRQVSLVVANHRIPELPSQSPRPSSSREVFLHTEADSEEDRAHSPRIQNPECISFYPLNPKPNAMFSSLSHSGFTPPWRGPEFDPCA